MKPVKDNLEEKLRDAFSKLLPQREFIAYKVLQTEQVIVVHVFSQAKNRVPIRPVPYQTFEFKPESLELRELIGPEAIPYRITKYK